MAEIDNRKALALLNKEILKQEQEIGRTLNANSGKMKDQNELARKNLKILQSTRKDLQKYLNGYEKISIELQGQADLANQLKKSMKEQAGFQDGLKDNALLITSLPIFPKPTTPNIFPLNSLPVNLFLSHFPFVRVL